MASLNKFLSLSFWVQKHIYFILCLTWVNFPINGMQKFTVSYKAEDYTFHMCLVILGITIICKLEFMESAPGRDFSLTVEPLLDGLLEHSSTQMGFKSRTILS